MLITRVTRKVQCTYVVEQVAVVHCVNVENPVVPPQLRGEKAFDAPGRLLIRTRALWGGGWLCFWLPFETPSHQSVENPPIVLVCDAVLGEVLLKGK